MLIQNEKHFNEWTAFNLKGLSSKADFIMICTLNGCKTEDAIN